MHKAPAIDLRELARHLVGVAMYVLLFAILLFGPAQTLQWTRAWILLAVLFVVRVAGVVSVLRVNGELLREREKLSLQRDQLTIDKLLLPACMASFAGLVAFNAVDRFYLRLLPAPPALVSAAGLLLFVLGWTLVALALRTNAFAATVVRHQAERNHAVVQSGVYGVVRHPMYAGLIPVMVGLSLWLESYAAALLALIPIALLAARIQVEERMLRDKLEGYQEYAARVRSRLIPGIW
jgi:protein-S-isoprenylcysteine O-methyltransferase Ste14